MAASAHCALTGMVSTTDEPIEPTRGARVPQLPVPSDAAKACRTHPAMAPCTAQDVMECEMAELFPNLTSPMEGNGQKRPLRHFLSNRSAAANSKQGQHEPQQQSQAEDDDADRAESEQDPARPPRLFTVLETHTGHLALRLNLLALQQWWADRNHTHTATPGHGAGRGAGLSPTGRSTSPLPPLNPAEPGLWVEALRGQRGHLAPSPSAGPTYAHTLCNGQGAAGVVGGARVAVRWNRSATCTAFGIVATGLDFQQADAELVDTQLCIKEVRLHRGMQRRRRNVVRAPVIAAAWRGGSAAAQLGRRVAAMLSQPPAAQGPAGPFSMSKVGCQGCRVHGSGSGRSVCVGVSLWLGRALGHSQRLSLRWPRKGAALG